MFKYKTKGTCSREIVYNVENGKITNVNFIGGCDGNLKGIGALVEGMDIEEVIYKLKDIKCGFKNTSCPAELAKALEEYKHRVNC